MTQEQVVYGQPTRDQVVSGYMGPDGYHYPLYGDTAWSTPYRDAYAQAEWTGNQAAAQQINQQAWASYNQSRPTSGGGGGGSPTSKTGTGTSYAYNGANGTYSYLDPATKKWVDNIASGDLRSHLSQQVQDSMPEWDWQQQFSQDPLNYQRTQNSQEDYAHRLDRVEFDPTGKYADIYQNGGRTRMDASDPNFYNSLNPWLQKQHSADYYTGQASQAAAYHTRDIDRQVGDSQRFGAMGNTTYNYTNLGV